MVDRNVHSGEGGQSHSLLAEALSRAAVGSLQVFYVCGGTVQKRTLDGLLVRDGSILEATVTVPELIASPSL